MATNNDRLGRFFLSCVNRIYDRTKLKLLQQALLPSVQNPLHGFRRAMLVRYLQLYAAGSTAVNSVRASLGEIHAKDSAQMAGELAGAVLASYGSHNLRKISPTDRLLVATELARLSTMENAARLKLGMVEDYR